MKKIISMLSLVALATVTTIAAFCIEPKGEVMGTINRLEADGFTLASIECAQVNYLVPPTPPYVNRIITVKMNKIECFGGDGPCALLGTAIFTADEVVVNNNGNTIQTNVSDVIVAL